MERVIAYVDGYNLYYGLRAKGWKRYYWLNAAVDLLERYHAPETAGRKTPGVSGA